MARKVTRMEDLPEGFWERLADFIENSGGRFSNPDGSRVVRAPGQITSEEWYANWLKEQDEQARAGERAEAVQEPVGDCLGDTEPTS